MQVDNTAQGVKEELSLRDSGFTDNEIQQWKDETAQTLADSGFNQKEIKEYFGFKEPDMSALKKEFDNNLKDFYGPPTPTAEQVAADKAASYKPREAKDFMSALEAGWKMSVTGLLAEQKRPDVVLPENSPMYYRIASQLGTLAGDVPAMIGGSFAGAATFGAAGSVVPIAGTAAGVAVGAGAGAFAVPTAMREYMMLHYEKGDVKDFKDFWERSSVIFLESSKAALIGGATAGVGGLVGKAVAPVASPMLKASTVAASEVATMVSVGSALEGKVPEPSEFIEAGILIAGMHGSVKAASKLRNIYAKTGIPPTEIIKDMEKNPTLKQDILSENKDIPTAYESSIDPKFKEEVKPEVKAEVKQPTPEPKQSPMDEANAKIREQIGEKTKAPKKGFSVKESFDKFYTDYIDKFDPIKKATETLAENPKELSANENPYILSRMSNDYKAKAVHAMEKGTIDFNTLEVNGKGFKEIISPFKSELDLLENYMVSKRAIELDARGIESGFDIQAAKDVVKKGDKKFSKASEEITNFQNNMLKYLKDSGRISEEAFTKMTEANKSYVPFSRLIEQESGAVGKPGTKSLKRIKGSEAGIQSPFVSILENTETLFKMAEKNRAAKSLIELAEKDTEQTLFTKVKSEMTSVELSKEEVAKILKQNGLEETPDNVEAAKIFRPKQRPLAENEFEIYRDGKREIYETDPEIAKAIKSLDGDKVATNFFTKFARGVTTAKKIGISLTPDFVIKNFIRDQVSAGVFTEGQMVSFVDTIKAMGDLVKKNDVYYNWLKSGGAQGSFLELNKSYLEKNIYKLNKETGFMDSAWNVVKTPVDLLKVAGSLTEHATRLAEFKKVSKGKTGGADVFKGGFAAREVTVDFSRMGAKMSALNAITAFTNVSVQGLDRTVRAFKENPKGVGIKAAAYITTPSLLLWWANKDDQRVKDLPNWQKDMFWIIATDDWQPVKDNSELQGLPNHLIKQNSDGTYSINKGIIYRIPKPQELGLVFGTIPERMMDKFFTDNPNAMKDLNKTMLETVTPSLVPDVAAPFWEQKFNKSFFTGGAIVPGHLEKMLPAYQYTDYTSETAKGVGQLIAKVPGIGETSMASPMVIENYVRNWTGTLGMYGLQVLDKGLEATGVTPPAIKPTSTLSDIPFVKSFIVRYPSAGTQPIIDFQGKVLENQKVLNTVKNLVKSGDMRYASVISQYESRMMDLSGMNEGISNMNRAIQLIYKNNNLGSDQQRQLIDGLYYQMTEVARNGNAASRQFEESIANLKKELESSKGEK